MRLLLIFFDFYIHSSEIYMSHEKDSIIKIRRLLLLSLSSHHYYLELFESMMLAMSINVYAYTYYLHQLCNTFFADLVSLKITASDIKDLKSEIISGVLFRTTIHSVPALFAA